MIVENLIAWKHKGIYLALDKTESMYADADSTIFTLIRGKRQYELKNHLGNVLATVTDRKIPKDNDPDSLVDYYTADIVTADDYYPFGMQMPERHWMADSWDEYRFGFQGMEKDNEVKGEGNHYTTQFRQYDPRVGQWMSIDPKIKPHESPYVGYSNNPINFIDPKGADTTTNDKYSREQLTKYTDPNSKPYNEKLDKLIEKWADKPKSERNVVFTSNKEDVEKNGKVVEENEWGTIYANEEEQVIYIKKNHPKEIGASPIVEESYHMKQYFDNKLFFRNGVSYPKGDRDVLDLEAEAKSWVVNNTRIDKSVWKQKGENKFYKASTHYGLLSQNKSKIRSIISEPVYFENINYYERKNTSSEIIGIGAKPVI